MPCWYFDKKELRDTPSIQDGITLETERRYRKEGARFIMTCGTQMGIGHNTIATGVVYFHRFYMFHSFKSFPRYVTACCCLLLAGKVEETPKKCRDIIATARTLLSDNYFYSFGKDPKEEVMTLERILLQTIKFDLQVEHPYTFLLKYAKCFKGDQQKLQKMVQMAWNFVNDSLSTVVCLQWEPEIIAVALIYLASKLSKFIIVDWVGRLPQHLRWWDMFVSDVTMEILEDICHQVLDLYQTNQKETPETQSPPQKPPSRADSPTPPTKLPVTGNSSGSPAGKTKATAANASTTPATATVSSNSQLAATANAQANPAVINTTLVGELNNIQSIKSLAQPTPGVVTGMPNAAMPPHPPPPAQAAPPGALLVGPAESIATATIVPSGAAYHHHHHMYGAPPPPPLNPHHPSMHALNMYGSGPPPAMPPIVGNGGTVAPAPPLPPQMAGGGGGGGGYGPSNANAWPGGPTGNAHHYPAVPPPPLPPSGPPPPGAPGTGNYYQGGPPPNSYGRQQRY